MLPFFLILLLESCATTIIDSLPPIKNSNTHEGMKEKNENQNTRGNARKRKEREQQLNQ